MKISQPTPEFAPITIVLETQEEANSLIRLCEFTCWREDAIDEEVQRNEPLRNVIEHLFNSVPSTD